MKKCIKLMAVVMAVACVFMMCACSSEGGSSSSSSSAKGVIDKFAKLCELKGVTYEDCSKISNPMTGWPDDMIEEFDAMFQQEYEWIASEIGENYSVTAEIISETSLKDLDKEEFEEAKAEYKEAGYDLEDFKIVVAKLIFDGPNGTLDTEEEFDVMKIDGAWKLEEHAADMLDMIF